MKQKEFKMFNDNWWLSKEGKEVYIKVLEKYKDAEAEIDFEELGIPLIETNPDKEFDIDRITEGINSSKRSQISTIRRIIDALVERQGKSISKQEIIDEAGKEGILDIGAKGIIEQLIKSGEVYEPKPNAISKVNY